MNIFFRTISMPMVLFLFCFSSFAVPITGSVQKYAFGASGSPRAVGGTITIKQTGTTRVLATVVPNKKGEWSANITPGTSITLFYKNHGYQSEQSASVLVPGKGTTIPLQVTESYLFPLMKAAWEFSTEQKFQSGMCHVMGSVMAYGKTVIDTDEGEPGAAVYLDSPVKLKPPYNMPHYLGAIKIAGTWYTNPLERGLTETSHDGGASYINLPATNLLYTIHAVKKGYTFSTAQFWCTPNALIVLTHPFTPSVTSNSIND